MYSTCRPALVPRSEAMREAASPEGEDEVEGRTQSKNIAPVTLSGCEERAASRRADSSHEFSTCHPERDEGAVEGLSNYTYNYGVSP
jgi:hypothetical protein